MGCVLWPLFRNTAPAVARPDPVGAGDASLRARSGVVGSLALLGRVPSSPADTLCGYRVYAAAATDAGSAAPPVSLSNSFSNPREYTLVREATAVLGSVGGNGTAACRDSSFPEARCPGASMGCCMFAPFAPYDPPVTFFFLIFFDFWFFEKDCRFCITVFGLRCCSSCVLDLPCCTRTR